MHQRHLASEDEALTRLFEDRVRPMAESDDAAWDEYVIRLLNEAGYTVRT